MSLKRPLTIALGILLLTCSQLIGALQHSCTVFPRLSEDECCKESLMDSTGHVLMETHSPLKYKGRFTSMKARLCGNDILWIQLWEVVNEQAYEFKLIWQVDVHVCDINNGWYWVNFPSTPAIVTDNTRLGYYSQSIFGVTEDKFAIPYTVNGTSYKIYQSNRKFSGQDQLNIGDVHQFEELRFPRSFEPNIVFYGDELGPPGPPGPPGSPGQCPETCSGRIGVPGVPGGCPLHCVTPGLPNQITCDVGEIDEIDRKLDSVKDDTDDLQMELKNLTRIINKLLQSQQVTGTCPEGFVSATYGIGSCYVIIRQPAQYGVALMHCRDNYLGANLLAIESDQEQVFIKTEIIRSKVGDPEEEIFWTAGMNSVTTSSAWIWYDGTNYPSGKKRITSNHWSPGQPRSASSNQRCLKLIVDPGTKKGEWQAAVCDEWHFYICEVPKVCL